MYDCPTMKKEEIQIQQCNLLQLIEDTDFINLQKIFDNQLSNQDKFLRNFMTMFEKLLLFVRSTQQGIWDLHLASLGELVKYFFAFNLQNYARLTPVYISQMTKLETTDPNISISKR